MAESYYLHLAGNAVWVHPSAARAALDKLMPSGFLGPIDPAWYHLRAAVSLIEHIARHPAGTEALLLEIREYRRLVKTGK